MLLFIERRPDQLFIWCYCFRWVGASGKKYATVLHWNEHKKQWLNSCLQPLDNSPAVVRFMLRATEKVIRR